eukprot:1161213-Pelagomonas_calceolata.AAC.3
MLVCKCTRARTLGKTLARTLGKTLAHTHAHTHTHTPHTHKHTHIYTHTYTHRHNCSLRLKSRSPTDGFCRYTSLLNLAVQGWDKVFIDHFIALEKAATWARGLLGAAEHAVYTDWEGVQHSLYPESYVFQVALNDYLIPKNDCYGAYEKVQSGVNSWTSNQASSSSSSGSSSSNSSALAERTA